MYVGAVAERSASSGRVSPVATIADLWRRWTAGVSTSTPGAIKKLRRTSPDGRLPFHGSWSRLLDGMGNYSVGAGRWWAFDVGARPEQYMS